MPSLQNLLAGNRKYLGVGLLLLFISVICVAFSMEGNDDFDFSRREVLLRRIGHEVLLQSGDSISRVLPVQKIRKDEYQVSFEHAFTFNPQSLVGTTQRWLAKDPLAGDYVVNVLHCDNAAVAYSYAIANNRKDDIISCIGRKQPVACYTINIRFKPTTTGIITPKHGYLLGSLALLSFVGFFFFKPTQPGHVLREDQSTQPVETEVPGAPREQSASVFTLGAILFDAGARKLILNGTTIDLTATENRLLTIFALSPNQVIERSRLQKEIWEDEGVIVGRSLDMFISKLRRKLEPDPDIKIVVIRGKGYRLEVSA